MFEDKVCRLAGEGEGVTETKLDQQTNKERTIVAGCDVTTISFFSLPPPHPQTVDKRPSSDGHGRSGTNPQMLVVSSWCCYGWIPSYLRSMEDKIPYQQTHSGGLSLVSHWSK